ncbi:MAG: hypothetical protein U0Z26_08635 [Anaerolineales bacterium]
MPNTFYAKQAEYVNWQGLPIADRLGQLLLQLFVGPSIALVPALCVWVYRSVKLKMWGSLASIIWCFAYFYLYISRLPVYQHGRYVMPAMPIFFLFGLISFMQFDASKFFGRYQWMARTAWWGGMIMLVVGFIYYGSLSYSKDVAVIESEMVVTAKWAAANLPSNALIAAHDIGALGYFDTHKLIDLAGLVSPEVIPFIRNRARTWKLSQSTRSWVLDCIS